MGGDDRVMKRNQTGIPVITHRFASEEIRPGDTWKVYIRAADPEGDMRNIICTVNQAGRGTYPVSFLRIPESQRRDLSGFLYLNTSGSQGLNFTNLTLQIEIQDRAGNMSRPVSFPLAFNARAQRENPPLGAFREEEVGPIMISLDPGASAP
jgi:hypothetical protein